MDTTEIVINSEQYTEIMAAIADITQKQAEILTALQNVRFLIILALVVWVFAKLCYHLVAQPFEGI